MISRSVTILGSTGSVGTATLDVIRANQKLFTVHALTAQTNVALLAEQAKRFAAKLAVIGDENLYEDLKDALLGTDIRVAAGREAIIAAAAEEADITMAAIVGMAGLEPLMAAIANGKNVVIANKEPLVAAGSFVIDAARQSGAVLLPVDSEHNAIFQVFEQENRAHIRRIILTASGGPFRTWTSEQIQNASLQDALKHPNWTMGRKITIDSATMVNKALEIIEARYLFDIPPEQIDVLIHPQSIVHSMVEYEDGSVLAQMGAPDMRVPISHAMGWPDRLGNAAQRLDFTALSTLTFEVPDVCRFPAIKLAYDCLARGQAACIAFNAANEMAVDAFLNGRIGFADIVKIITAMLEEGAFPVIDDLKDVLAYDSSVRERTSSYIIRHEATKRKVS